MHKTIKNQCIEQPFKKCTQQFSFFNEYTGKDSFCFVAVQCTYSVVYTPKWKSVMSTNCEELEKKVFFVFQRWQFWHGKRECIEWLFSMSLNFFRGHVFFTLSIKFCCISAPNGRMMVFSFYFWSGFESKSIVIEQRIFVTGLTGFSSTFNCCC